MAEGKQPNRAGRSVKGFLRAVVHQNRAMTVERLKSGRVVVTIPRRRPGWLIPPLSWVIPFSMEKRVELDSVGAAVLDMCDGRRRIESMIETFAREHKLSFREAQLPVTQFLRQMMQRGIVAVVGLDKEADE